MVEIIQFTPQKSLSAKRKLQNLITLSRDHLVTWADLPDFEWSKSYWPTTSRGIKFTNQENRGLHPSQLPEPHQLMAPEFTQLTKAYLRYRHTIKPHRNIAREMQALRVLEIVLRRDLGVPDITMVNQRHFDQAVSELAIYKAHAFIARELLSILKTLADFYIVTPNCHFWKNPHIGKDSYAFANGDRAGSDIKDKKLPNQDALLAIAAVFGRGNTAELDDVDTMVTSITCLLLSAPMRIGEVLRLRTDCIASDTDKDGNLQHHLKYWAPKTRQFIRKPIPTTMAANALEALNRLKQITDEGRRLARYMETNPTAFYRHVNCPDIADDKELTRDQVAQALGFAHRKSSEDFILRHTGRRALKGFTLNSLWQIVLAEHKQSNPHFPFQQFGDAEASTPLRMSDSLLCFFRLQLSVKNTTSPVLLAPFNKDYFSNRLSASVNKGRDNKRPMCFFTRHGFEAIQLKSHSLRHLLNRLARRSGVSIDTITAWSSRASSKQTLTYLNDNPTEAAATGAALLKLHDQQSPKSPVLDEEAELHSQGPFHRSRYGLCRRSWRAGPCNRFADCLNCSELLMCKGDRLAVDTIEKDREYLVRTYTAAQLAIKNGERSVSRWTNVAGPQIQRLDQLLSVLNNNRIPDGSPIEMVGTDFSHEDAVLEGKAGEVGIKLLDRKTLAIEYGSELINCLELLSSNDNA